MGTFTNPGSTLVDDSTVGTVAWTNPGNAVASDNSYATAALLVGQITHYLKVTGFNFAIPTDATVTGITLSVERSDTGVGVTINDSSVKLVKGGVISGNDKATGTAWPSSDGTATYGSSSDLWGLTWTPSDINASTFGAVVSATAGVAGTAQIDYISIAVDYTGSNPVRTYKIQGFQ